jgi:hypothetical protein
MGQYIIQAEWMMGVRKWSEIVLGRARRRFNMPEGIRGTASMPSSCWGAIRGCQIELIISISP